MQLSSNWSNNPTASWSFRIWSILNFFSSLIFTMAERLSSKFQVFLLASLLGRISVFRSISQLWTLPATRKGLFTKLGRYETRGHWFWLWQVVLINALYSHKAHPVYFINIEWVEWTKLTWRGDSARPRLSQKKDAKLWHHFSVLRWLCWSV